MYKFVTLANGVKFGPLVFTKVCKPILGHCRQLGIKILMYIDDIFVTASTKEECENHRDYVVGLLLNCGFLINWYIHLVPSQNIILLGFQLNSKRMDMSLTPDHQQMLLKFIDELRLQKITTIRNFARLIGLLVAIMPVFLIGRFHYRVLEKEKLVHLRKYKFNWSHSMLLSANCKLTMA